MNRLKDEQGISLMELIAAIAISSVLVIAAYTLLMSGMKTSERIAVETQMRDEADYIMGNMIETFYLTRTSEIGEEQLPLEGTDDYLIQLTGEPGLKIGFEKIESAIIDEDGDPEQTMQVYVVNQGQQDVLTILNQSVSILPEETSIKKVITDPDNESGQYQITLTLKSTSGHTLTTESEISIIPDI